MTLRRKCIGAKRFTEAVDVHIVHVVGERSKCVEVRPEGLVEHLEVRMPV